MATAEQLSKYGTPWVREELILAFDLYCKTPFQKTKTSNRHSSPPVAELGEGEYVDSLVNEYATLLRGRLSEGPQKQYDETDLVEGLSASADWTAQGARELVRLADDYGAFMLRNALAIAIVLGKEDGTQGF